MDKKREVLKAVGQSLIIFNEVLGQGSYGIVYTGKYFKTKDQQFPVAVKIIKKQKLNELKQQNYEEYEKLANQFQREAKILKQISHMNIINLHEIIETESNIYFIQELCPDGQIPDPNNENYSSEQVLMVFIQLCDAMFYLHENQICHRDLKPANILLSGDLIKVADFGFSKVLHEGNYNKDNTQLGSPLYASPQAIESSNYDPYKQDIWSCGILLYQMVYQKYPWTGNSIQDLLKQILSQPLKLYEKKDLDPDLINLIQNMLNKDQNLRFGWEDVKKHPIIQKYQKYSKFKLKQHHQTKK